MTLRSDVSPRAAIAAILCVVYAILLITLISASRHEATLAPQVRTAENAIAQAISGRTNEAQSLQAGLAAAQQRLNVLQQQVPKTLPDNLFVQIAQDAQSSGIGNFRYQRKTDTLESLQFGSYRVYHFTIQGTGSQDTLAAFMDRLQNNSGQTTVLENVSLTAAGQDWQLSADVSVYTLGG